MYKQTYAEVQLRHADNLKARLDQAIIDFKAFKRQAAEKKAGLLLKDSFRKHMFRNRLDKSLKARALVQKHAFNAAYIRKLTKFLICDILSKRVVSTSFNRARERIDGRATWNVQRAFRGFMCRNQDDRIEWVKESIAAKENLRLHVSAKKIQKRLKGLIVRRRIDYMSKKAAIIQSFFKMRWVRDVFIMIKRNTMILQRGVRRYLARRDMIRERMQNYLTQEYQVMNNVREMENFQLFGSEKTKNIK